MIHAYLATKHYSLHFGEAQPSLCNINATFDCDTVAASSYSVFAGYPLALWGALINLLFAGWAGILAYWKTPTPNPVWKLIWGQTGIALVSVVMAVISFTQLRTYCLFCLATYIFSFAALAAAWSAAPKTKPRWLDIFTGKDIWAMAIAVVVLIWIVDGLFLKEYGGERLSKLIRESVNEWSVQTPIAFPEPTGALTKGASAADAKVHIVEFADFLCPHCAHASQKLKTFLKSHGDVRLTFMFFPLDSECNAELSGRVPAEGFRCQLARLVYCANQKGMGWEVHDLIFENQQELARSKDAEGLLGSKFSAMGLPYTELKSCTELTDTKAAVSAQARKVVEAKIEGTPTIFVNGRMAQGGYQLPILNAIYQKAKSEK